MSSAGNNRNGIGYPPEGAVVVHFDEPLTLAGGKVLNGCDVAYETFGELNAAKSNAVLICHALSGDSHVTSNAPPAPDGVEPDNPGWWEQYVGPGKPIDTQKYFVICSNVLGGCKGTTGPGSINPRTGKPWGLDFPIITISDMVETQRRLIDHLGINTLLAVVGGSMGGMQALQWSVQYPDRMRGVIPVATTTSLGAQPLAFDTVGRNAILSDPAFNEGRYAEQGVNPSRGLAIARMLGHITYLSEQAMHEKFGRSLRHGEHLNYDFASQFSVETYLDYQGGKFVERFDANTYLYITRAMDYFDLAENFDGDVQRAMGSTKARFLVMSFTSDWLFTPEQNRRIVRALARSGRLVSYLEIPSPYGHDAFLLDSPQQERALAGFLACLLRDADQQPAPAVDLASLGEDEKKRLDLERITHLIRPGESVLDLGCGEGRFLAHLRSAGGCAQVQGVDVDVDKCVACIEYGVDVVQADLDQPLDYFGDKSFDAVVLSRTLQVVRHPPVVMSQMLRIGKRGIVTFPNFGYWRNRHQMVWAGRVPVSRNLPFSWADTPNLHHLSMKDFEDWCRSRGVRVLHRIAMDYQADERIRLLPNLRATDAIYEISRE